jgi:phage terminase large subunit
VTVVEGAYYAASLTTAKLERRIGRVAADPLLTLRLFCDIGGTGARADAFSIWVKQFVGREIRALDYYEAVGQSIGTHLDWMRRRGYLPGRAEIWLPHDGETQDRVYNVSYESAFKLANYNVTVVPNQGKGAAKSRIEAGRRHFPAIWFNAPEGADWETTPTCAAGIEALGWYHEKRDDERGIGLGPEHDWASHCGDSFGLGCISADRIFNEGQRQSAPLVFDRQIA